MICFPILMFISVHLFCLLMSDLISRSQEGYHSKVLVRENVAFAVCWDRHTSNPKCALEMELGKMLPLWQAEEMAVTQLHLVRAFMCGHACLRIHKNRYSQVGSCGRPTSQNLRATWRAARRPLGQVNPPPLPFSLVSTPTPPPSPRRRRG